MFAQAPTVSSWLASAFLERNRIFEEFFSREAARLAQASREMAKRFQDGGRLLAFGRGACSTDAQHISVEFVHPVIVGKRALPALDLSAAGEAWLRAIVRPEDIVVGFGPPEGDREVEGGLAYAEAKGAMTLALPGACGWYAFQAVDLDPFVHQEMTEILYHTLWETVHVFLEHTGIANDAGDASFLYPFLGNPTNDDHLLDEVAGSILTKVRDDAALRVTASQTQAATIEAAVAVIREAVARGGSLILFGNGGSATDANDWALDCVLPPAGYPPIPAISLAMEPANITALANDVGTELIFVRQLIAQAKPADVAIGISTSGGSRNIIAALQEARRRGLRTLALLGYDGGEIARSGLADHCIVVGCDYIPRIQEVQASLYHALLALLREPV